MTAKDDKGGGRLTMSVVEAGQRLGVGKQAAYDAAHRGEIPIIRVGRRLSYPSPPSMPCSPSSRSSRSSPPNWCGASSRRPRNDAVPTQKNRPPGCHPERP